MDFAHARTARARVGCRPTLVGPDATSTLHPDTAGSDLYERFESLVRDASRRAFVSERDWRPHAPPRATGVPVPPPAKSIEVSAQFDARAHAGDPFAVEAAGARRKRRQRGAEGEGGGDDGSGDREVAVEGFFGGDEAARAALPPVSDSLRLLARFDAEQMAAARERRAPRQLGGCEPKVRGSLQWRHARASHRRNADVARAPRAPSLPPARMKALRRAVISAAAHSHTVMLGICAPSQDKGMASLRLWTDALGLPRGKLHGADVDGVPIEMPEGCAVFIKVRERAWPA